MSHEDFTKGISPAGGRRLEPGSHMESERAPVKSAEGDQHWSAVLPLAAAAKRALPSPFTYVVQKASGKLR